MLLSEIIQGMIASHTILYYCKSISYPSPLHTHPPHSEAEPPNDQGLIQIFFDRKLYYLNMVKIIIYVLIIVDVKLIRQVHVSNSSNFKPL